MPISCICLIVVVDRLHSYFVALTYILVLVNHHITHVVYQLDLGRLESTEHTDHLHFLELYVPRYVQLVTNCLACKLKHPLVFSTLGAVEQIDFCRVHRHTIIEGESIRQPALLTTLHLLATLLSLLVRLYAENVSHEIRAQPMSGDRGDDAPSKKAETIDEPTDVAEPLE